MAKFFIADTHFATPNLVRGMGRCFPRTNRLFGSAEEHDEYLIDCINAVVTRNDHLYILGDFARERPGKYRQQIKCKHVHLILGNHDNREKCKRVFSTCKDLHEVRVKNLKVVLCHYPLIYWNGSHRGWGHLHGHTHGQRNLTLDSKFPQRRMMDVSVDSLFWSTGGYFPLSEETAYNYLMSFEGHDDPFYYKDIRDARNDRLGITGDMNW